MSSNRPKWLVSFLVAILIPKSINAITVRTTSGLIEGDEVTTTSGQKAVQFLGIPFAEPPIGDLRFERPRPPIPWNYIRRANGFAPICNQLAWRGVTGLPEGSEDCLYLNVFAPAINNTNEGVKYPVWFWIHGGGFSMGSAVEFQPTSIIDNLVSRDVIAVTIQFASTGDNVLPGNLGLWDQIEALKWVNQNIEAFGGDPTRVTIDGESAGAASVSILSYAPPAQEYFHGVIMQSGSIFTPWGLSTDSYPVSNTKLVAEALGCPTADSRALVQCLKGKSSKELNEAQANLVQNNSNSNKPSNGMKRNMPWVPVVDNTLVLGNPMDMEPTVPLKPALIGTNMDEGLFALGFIGPEKDCDSYVLNTTGDNWNLALEDILPQNDRKTDLMAEASEIYVKECLPEDQKYFCAVIDLLGDQQFTIPAFYEALLRSRLGKVWLYEFDYFNPDLFRDSLLCQGVNHAFELWYLMPNANSTGMLFNWTESDQKVADMFGEYWTNFVKKSPGNHSDLYWPEFSAKSPAKLFIHPGPWVEESSFSDRMVFGSKVRMKA